MTVQMLSREETEEMATNTIAASAGLDMDAIDCALDRGDLDTVREMLGFTPDAWRMLLQRL